MPLLVMRLELLPLLPLLKLAQNLKPAPAAETTPDSGINTDIT